MEATLYEPFVALILQGSKITAAGEQRVILRPGDALLISHDLPVVSQITEASVETPYLALNLSLDTAIVQSLVGQVERQTSPLMPPRPMAIGQADRSWLDPLLRYFEMMHAPADAKVLGPSTLLEIHYRLIQSPIGETLRSLVFADSHASRIAKAIARIRAGFREPLSVAELAQLAAMSQSSFHEHFKSVTGTTPLQFIKDLRLIEAQALLRAEAMSVSEIGFEVGYESATHFSRDYSQKFGCSPRHHRTKPANETAPRLAGDEEWGAQSG
ncbi:MAG: AraC family transcriptional regulator [Neomegalonema sp.]|nr:AraC family transcriptional regulator [Neomegalonema sp.]